MVDWIYECEIRDWVTDPIGQRKLGWVKVAVTHALSRKDPTTRCVECHGEVRLHRAGPDGVPAAHAEHRVGHPGCSLGHYFDGTKRAHPHALEY
jgi:hypothetical protein